VGLAERGVYWGMKIKTPILESERLGLRKFKLADAQEVVEMFADDKRKRANTLKKAKEWIKKSVNNDGYYLAIVLREENKVIGNVELCHFSWFEGKGVEICYRLNRKYRGKGYVTEAVKVAIDYCFKKLKLRKIYADTDPDNRASQRVLEKLNFKLEGVIRERRKVGGKWVDEMQFGLLRKEWKK